MAKDDIRAVRSNAQQPVPGDHYGPLGVDRLATIDEIKLWHRQLAQIRSPDQHGDLHETRTTRRSQRAVDDGEVGGPETVGCTPSPAES